MAKRPETMICKVYKIKYGRRVRFYVTNGDSWFWSDRATGWTKCAAGTVSGIDDKSIATPMGTAKYDHDADILAKVLER